MSILSRFTYSLEVKFIEDPESQVDALLQTSSAKMKTQHRAAIRHLIDTLKYVEQFGIPFRGHRDSGRLEPISDIKDIDTSTAIFRSM